MRKRIMGSRAHPVVGELPTSIQDAWNEGWRPKSQASFRLWCLTGCGASLYTRDHEVYGFVCLTCRRECTQFLAGLAAKRAGGAAKRGPGGRWAVG
jgi:hypothetical protein